MVNLSNDHKDHPNQQQNSHKPHNKRVHPVLNLLESQWKLRQHDQNFPMEGKPLKKELEERRRRKNPKEQDCENHSQGSQ